MILLDLPLPPSGNRSARTGKGRHYTPAPIKAYRWAVAAERDRSVKTIPGEFYVEITLFPPREGRFDLDNRVKTLMDALQAAGFFANDGDCTRMLITRGAVLPPHGRAVVTISG